jgi:predicted CXXCH cytochrome family protein
MQSSAAELKSATTASNPCASCHKRMFNAKFVHGPEGVFQCIDCHDRNSAPNRWQVSKDEVTLCGECHTDKIAEIKKDAFVHGPVASGSCTVCHDPHASEQPAQLHAPINALCSGCHGSVAKGQHVVRGVSGQGHPLDQGSDPLRPGRTMSCASCHDPHGGSSEYFFAGNVTSRFALCGRCHQK